MIITQDKVFDKLVVGKEYTPEEVTCLMFQSKFTNIRNKLIKLAIRKRIERKFKGGAFVYTRKL